MRHPTRARPEDFQDDLFCYAATCRNCGSTQILVLGEKSAGPWPAFMEQVMADDFKG